MRSSRTRLTFARRNLPGGLVEVTVRSPHSLVYGQRLKLVRVSGACRLKRGNGARLFLRKRSVHFDQGFSDRIAKILIVIVFVFIIGIEDKELGDDVCTMGTKRLCLAVLDVFAFRTTFSVSVFAKVNTCLSSWQRHLC